VRFNLDSLRLLDCTCVSLGEESGEAQQGGSGRRGKLGLRGKMFQSPLADSMMMGIFNLNLVVRHDNKCWSREMMKVEEGKLEMAT
jgi:hypothetical protein